MLKLAKKIPLVVTQVVFQGQKATLFCADEDTPLAAIRHELEEAYSKEGYFGELALIDADSHPAVALIMERIRDDYGTIAVRDQHHGHYVVTRPAFSAKPPSRRTYTTGQILKVRSDPRFTNSLVRIDA